MNHGLIPYIGGKHRMANTLVRFIKQTGATAMVDVFGGSAAVLIACAMNGFAKRVYNDIDGDLVNLFRVIADPVTRRELFFKLRWFPFSRQTFEHDKSIYTAAGFSFRTIEDKVDRARATLYRHMFSFGGKTRSGGMSVSIGDRFQIKEIGRYRNTLQRLAVIGNIFRDTVIECMHYNDLIPRYGRHAKCVLYADPPYVGTEHYYSNEFSDADHVFLATALNQCHSHVVVSYYDCPIIRELYPENRWTYNSVQATANTAFMRSNKKITTELVLVKKDRPE